MSLEQLRAQIRSIEGGPTSSVVTPTGVLALDRLLGGMPTPGLVEISGSSGSGKRSLALLIVANVTTNLQQRVAWIDLSAPLYPPTAARLGVSLSRLLLLRPVPERLMWACEQAVRSGCFPLVVLTDAILKARTGYRLMRAAEDGRCTLLLLKSHPSRTFPAHQRLSISDGCMTLIRDRIRGSRVGTVPLPSPPKCQDPWR